MILDALQRETVRATCEALVTAGVSCVPVKGKRALVAWQSYSERLPSVRDVYEWFQIFNVTGVAIITGHVSGNLVIVDLDGREAARVFGETFPELAKTLVVRSGAGWHAYYYSDSPIKTARLVNHGAIKEIGVRSDNHYTLAPPSLHPSGAVYTVARHLEPLRVSDLNNVTEWINSQRAPAPIPKPPANRTAGANPAYVESVVKRELDYVRLAGTGSRNENLFHASRRLAMLVANPDSGLYESEIRGQLYHAAAAAGLPAPEALRTIESGFKRGLKEPRQIPAVRHE